MGKLTDLAAEADNRIAAYLASVEDELRSDIEDELIAYLRYSLRLDGLTGYTEELINAIIEDIQDGEYKKPHYKEPKK